MSHGQETRALLPKHFTPKRYALHLTPDLKAFTFAGEVTVDVEVKHATSTIVIHCLDIKVNEVEFHQDGHVLKSPAISYQEKEETVTFQFSSEIKVGKGSLQVKYQGNLNDQMIGFYRSKYFVNGEERYMGTTQMEPTGARRAFPGWDEPAYKAVFDITITAPQNLQVLSNMEPVNEKSSNGLKTVTFASTPIMSTYLVAFVIGEFDHVEDVTKEGITVRVFTPLGKKELGTFALDVGVKVLSYFIEYYGISYPLKKMDMIAIPDFSAGAMENWGLVTYRETALLIDSKNSGVGTKQRVAYVVAHELAHQWFGNLVTMEWWKELWLNEGFATFVGNQAIDKLFPEWDIWTQFVSQYVNRAQDLDGLENSHPIEVEVYSSAQIDEIFDAISYSKGASVIRMICDIIGEPAFRKGLNIYLNKHKFSNAVTEDLWKALGEASGFQVKEFMDKYIKITGYPLVTISSTSKPDEFVVEQKRFFSSGKEQSEAEAQAWWINIGVSTSKSNEVHKHDLKSRKETLKFPEVVGAEWFKVNARQSGFFRVKYSADISAKLTHAISTLALPTVDRIGIQGDAFALAKAGFISTVEALQLAKAYVNEKDYTVWSDLATNLGGMSSVWSNEPNFADLKKFARNLYSTIGQSVGWEPKTDESALTTLLRAVILGQLSANDDKGVIEEARKRFSEQIHNNKPIPADLRFIVYKTVVANGGKAEYEAVLNIFRTADLHEEKLRALRALGYNNNPEFIERTLQLGLTDEVRSQDIMYVIIGVAAHKEGREMGWQFFKNKFEDYNKRLKDTAMLMDRVVGYTISGFTSEERAKDIENFFEKHPVPQAERTIKQSLETIRANTKWVTNNRESVAKFLAEQH